MTAGVTDISRAISNAEHALQQAFADPLGSVALADAALAVAESEGDPMAISLAEQALGLTARFLGDVATATTRLRRAVRVADRAGLAHRAAEARISLSFVLTMAGESQAALQTLDQAADVLAGTELARVEAQRAAILRRVGRPDDALAGLRRALPVLRRAGDALWEARALSQRGLVQVEQGAFGPAEADLRRCQELFEALGQRRDAASGRHNRGWCAARAGDIPAALEHYDVAEKELVELGLTMAEVPLDRARLLLSVGLATDALALATLAAERYAASSDLAGYAEATLASAEAALLQGDPAAARARATEARTAFAMQRRPAWMALARHTENRAAWDAEERSPSLQASATRAAAELDRLGLPSLAAESLLIAGRTAFALRRRAAGRRALTRVSKDRLRGTAAQRARGWLAEALLRLDDGRRIGAQSALRAGVAVLDDYCTSLGATEFRAHAAGAASELATLGLRVAVGSGRPTQVLAWTERWRAGSLRTAPVRPPADHVLAGALAELRKVVEEIGVAGAQGRPTHRLLRRQAELEESVRRRAQRARGGQREVTSTPAVGEISDALRGRALVEIVEVDAVLLAVVVAAGRARLRTLGPMQPIIAEMGAAHFGLRRLAYGRGSSGSLDAAREMVDHAGRRLDELLLDPIRSDIGDSELVVVPPGALHAMPWSVLPSCRGRAVVAVPSAACWLRATGVTKPAGGRVVLIEGPGLPGANDELTQLAGLHRKAVCLRGAEATVAATCAALDGAALAHVAAHGHFRADNPLFSSLVLADGPVTVYDLERLKKAPHQMVLSACDSGLAAVRPGDELMGLAAALLGLGTSSLVVSVVPVPDGATAALMVGLHDGLCRGEPMPVALANAGAALDEDDGAMLAARAAFVCLGA